jgi:peptidyl-prolyl cis-trans isomerase D
VLDFMRRNARSWFIKIALGIICLVFVFFMGGGGQIGGGPAAVAVVDSTEISIADFQRAQLNNQAYYRDLYGDSLSPEMLDALDIPSASLSRLVDTTLMSQEAHRLNLLIPDETVRREIRGIDVFQRDGDFSPAQYRSVLQRQGLSPSAFEASMREEMLVNQLRDVVAQGVIVTEDDAWEKFQRGASEISLSFVQLKSSNFEDAVEVSEEDVELFFEEQGERWRRAESAGVNYLAYSPESFQGSAGVSEEEIEEYYLLNVDTEFTTEEQIGARHILKRVATDASDDDKAATRTAMEAVASKLADGADFEELAKTESEDSTASDGGDLGMFGRQKMVKPFENAAFALAEGEVSGITETRFGLHLIKVYKRQAPQERKLEDSRDEIRNKLAARKSTDIAFDKAAEASVAMVDGASMEEMAQADGLTIKSTPLLDRDQQIVPGVGRAPSFIEAALALESKTEVSDPVKAGNTWYVLQLADQQASYVPELADVREEVEAEFRKRGASRLARERADKLLASARESNLADAAKEASLEVGEAGPVRRDNNFIKGIGALPAVVEATFRTTADGELLPRSFVHRGNAYVLARGELSEASREDFDEVKEERLAELERGRSLEAYTAFVNYLKERASITYNPDLVASVRP